jgi:hypothetical protein
MGILENMAVRSMMRALTLWTVLRLISVSGQELPAADRFDIFTQMNLHQAYIDLPGSCEDSKKYASLYWPDASFRVIDPSLRDNTVRIPFVVWHMLGEAEC